MTSAVIDARIVIDHLRGRDEARQYLRGLPELPLLSAVTIAELFAGVREGGERTVLEALLTAFRVVPIDEPIARRGGLYRRRFHRSHGVGLVDALIAATADAMGARLATLNVKHFPMFADVIVPYRA
jgi:predicted nucleic acid-binding protein